MFGICVFRGLGQLEVLLVVRQQCFGDKPAMWVRFGGACELGFCIETMCYSSIYGPNQLFPWGPKHDGQPGHIAGPSSRPQSGLLGGLPRKHVSQKSKKKVIPGGRCVSFGGQLPIHYFGWKWYFRVCFLRRPGSG